MLLKPNSSPKTLPNPLSTEHLPPLGFGNDRDKSDDWGQPYSSSSFSHTSEPPLTPPGATLDITVPEKLHLTIRAAGAIDVKGKVEGNVSLIGDSVTVSKLRGARNSIGI